MYRLYFVNLGLSVNILEDLAVLISCKQEIGKLCSVTIFVAEYLVFVYKLV